jgi:hypothetical protein
MFKRMLALEAEVKAERERREHAELVERVHTEMDCLPGSVE